MESSTVNATTLSAFHPRFVAHSWLSLGSRKRWACIYSAPLCARTAAATAAAGDSLIALIYVLYLADF